MTAKIALVGIISLSLLATSVSAQDTPQPTQDAGDVDETRSVVRAYFTADNSTPRVGEPVELMLNFEMPLKGGTLLDWPDVLEDDWTRFMIRRVGEPTESQVGETRKYQQAINVILWTPGDYRTPDMFVDYQLAAQDIFHIPVQPVFLSVPSVLDGVNFDLRPLKPPVSLFYVSPLLVLAGGAGFALIARRRMMASRQPRPQTTEAPAPRQLALSELRELGRRKASPAEVYTGVADCLRTYLQRRFELPAMDMTSDELLGMLRFSDVLPERLQRELRHLLQQADLVKFARAEPNARVAARLLVVASGWLERVESAVSADEVQQA